jgi:hypothetical protein
MIHRRNRQVVPLQPAPRHHRTPVLRLRAPPASLAHRASSRAACIWGVRREDRRERGAAPNPAHPRGQPSVVSTRAVRVEHGPWHSATGTIRLHGFRPRLKRSLWEGAYRAGAKDLDVTSPRIRTSRTGGRWLRLCWVFRVHQERGVLLSNSESLLVQSHEAWYTRVVHAIRRSSRRSLFSRGFREARCTG